MNQEQRSFAVQVDVAGNGYIVRPPYEAQRGGICAMTEMKVFESFESLVEHLRCVLPIYPVYSGMTVTTTPPPKRRR
jgi:hypothetical protein